MAQSEDRVIEEVVVTATKRAQSAQDVPIAISAFDDEMIEDHGIVSIKNLESLTPGLNIAQSDASRTKVRIRGIGSRKFDVGSEGSVGVFVDEIYMPRFSGIEFTLLDLERIEVLKGPQGTLFGRNTTGGAVSLISKGPTEEFEGDVQVEAGNKDSYIIKGAVSGPVSDNLSLRFSYGYSELGGFNKNLATGDTDDRSAEAYKLQARWDASPTLSFSGGLQISSQKQDAVLGTSLPTLPGNLAIPLLAPPGTTVAVTPDPRKEALNFDGDLDIDSSLATLRIEKEFDNTSFVSLTGYWDSELDLMEDFDHTPLDIGQAINDEESDTFSQEFRLSGGNWIVGAYYYVDEAERSENFGWRSNSLPFLIAGGTNIVTSTIVDIETTSWGLFGQYTFDVTDDLSVTLGARYSDDEKDFVLSGETTSPVPAPIVPFAYTYADKVSWDSFDPKISVEYRLPNDALLYLTYSSGYKSGGVQFTAGTIALARETFDPEELDAYELGIKTDLAGGRVRFNASAFYYDYTDLHQQRVEIIGGSPAALTRNAGTSEIQGLEIDLLWLATDSLELRLGYAYLDAEFSEFIGTGGVNFAGNPVPNSPENTLTFSASYQTRLSNDWGLRFGLDWYYSDEYNFDVSDTDPFTKQDSYDTGAARIGITSPGDRISITAFVENLTDEDFMRNITRRGPEVLVSPADGRRYGLRARYQF